MNVSLTNRASKSRASGKSKQYKDIGNLICRYPVIYYMGRTNCVLITTAMLHELVRKRAPN